MFLCFASFGARVIRHVSWRPSRREFRRAIGGGRRRGRASAWDTFGCVCVLRGLVHGSFVTLWGVVLFRRVLCPCVCALIVWLCVYVFVSVRVCVCLRVSVVCLCVSSCNQ